jgi:hypothetical protein
MVAFGEVAPGEPLYLWNNNESLKEALENSLPSAEQRQKYRVLRPAEGGGETEAYSMTKDDDPPEPDCDLEFSGFFTLHDMDRLAGFVIRWTDNFLSHLRVRRPREPGFTTTVFIFHHAAILANIGVGYVP